MLLQNSMTPEQVALMIEALQCWIEVKRKEWKQYQSKEEFHEELSQVKLMQVHLESMSSMIVPDKVIITTMPQYA